MFDPGLFKFIKTMLEYFDPFGHFVYKIKLSINYTYVMLKAVYYRVAEVEAMPQVKHGRRGTVKNTNIK